MNSTMVTEHRDIKFNFFVYHFLVTACIKISHFPYCIERRILKCYI